MAAMKTTREVKGVGLSIPRPDGPEKVTGQRAVRRRHQAQGPAARQAAAQPARPRQDRLDRHQRGQGAARRARGAHRRRHPASEEEGADARPRRARHRSRGVRRPAGGRGGRRRAGHRRGGARPDRGRVRGAARLDRSAQVDAARRAAGGRRGHRGRHQRGARPLRRWPSPRASTPAKAVNISQQARLQRGDVAKGFAESDLVLEKTYRVPMVHQGYLEPHAVLAEWDRNGLLTLWSSTQGSFNTRSEVADVLGHPGEPDPGHPDGVRRRLRRQDPRALRADHRGAGAGHQAAGALRHDPARRAAGGHARARRSSSSSRPASSATAR